MKQFSGPIYLFFAFTLAGTGVLSARYLSDKLGTFTITAVSLFFALLITFPFCVKSLIRSISKLSPKGRILLFLQGLFGMFLFRMFLILGLLHTSAGEAGLLIGATPAITAILATILLKEKADRFKAAGIFSTVIGIFLIQGLTAGSGFSKIHFIGNLLVLCAACCESFFNILSRSFAKCANEEQDTAIHPITQTTAVSALTLLLCLIPAAFEAPVSHLFHLDLLGWFALLWYGVFVTVLAFICWYAGINRCGAITAAAFSGMMPFTSLVLSVLLLGEAAGFGQWFGGLFVISGILLIAADKKSEN